jgi:AmiR/NasT family two-component response regulator
MLKCSLKSHTSDTIHGVVNSLAMEAEESSAVLSGKRVVIAEDQGVTQLQLRRILQSAGLEVVGVAANGREAVDLVIQTKPDLVLMDVQMPVMDGLEAARLILEQFNVCIVMLTAYSETERQLQARRIGMFGYIVKPVTASTLVPQLAIAMQKFTGIDSFLE